MAAQFDFFVTVIIFNFVMKPKIVLITGHFSKLSKFYEILWNRANSMPWLEILQLMENWVLVITTSIPSAGLHDVSGIETLIH